MPRHEAGAKSSADSLGVLAPPVLARACDPARHEVVAVVLSHMFHPYTAASIALELRPCTPRLLCERLMLLRLPCPCSDASRVLRVVPDADRPSAGACVRVSPLEGACEGNEAGRVLCGGLDVRRAAGVTF